MCWFASPRSWWICFACFLISSSPCQFPSPSTLLINDIFYGGGPAAFCLSPLIFWPLAGHEQSQRKRVTETDLGTHTWHSFSPSFSPRFYMALTAAASLLFCSVLFQWSVHFRIATAEKHCIALSALRLRLLLLEFLWNQHWNWCQLTERAFSLSSILFLFIFWGCAAAAAKVSANWTIEFAIALPLWALDY